MTTKKKLYHVPYLRPEHCTREYMDAVGVEWYHGDATYDWFRHIFGSDLMSKSLSVFDTHGWWIARTPEQHARCFNAVAKSLGARPTGKPYPLPRKATR